MEERPGSRKGIENHIIMDAEQITLTIATGVSILIFLPALPRFVNLFSQLWSSLFRTGTCIRIEDSRKVQRSRDIVFWTSVPGLMTIVWHCGLYAPEWLETLPPQFHLPCVAGVMLGYFLLCITLGHIVLQRRLRPKVYEAATGCPKNFWILLAFTLFVATIPLKSSGIGNNVSVIVMYCITGLLYFIFLIRRFQIFASDSNYLTAILYLCALEILPTALFVTSALIF